LGAALFVWHQLLEQPRTVSRRDRQRGSLLGPAFRNDDITSLLDREGAKYQRAESDADLASRVADLLERGLVVGWFQGRMEFGPRSLGARSILGDPRSPAMQATMNLKIKFRESFRPFAPCVLAERSAEWFDLDPQHESPYMLLVAAVHEDRRLPVDDAQRRLMSDDPDLRRRLNVPRSVIPAVTHIDNSARVQTVDDERNPRLASLLRAFEARTGCPVLVNTSFNVRGEPIVCTPDDAYRCFLATDMDVLVLEDCIVLKTGVRDVATAERRAAHLAQFQLD
jgi:carbamoyltransferase